MTSRKITLPLRVSAVLLILIMALTLNTGISSAATPSFKATAKVNSFDGAFVRAKASKSSKKVTGLLDNTGIIINREVFVTKSKTGLTKKWYRIKSGKKTGYIRADLVDTIKYTKPVKIKITQKASCRKGAGVYMKEVKIYPKGKELTAVMIATSSNKTDWYKVRDGKKYYYVTAAKVKVISDTNSASPSDTPSVPDQDGTTDQDGTSTTDPPADTDQKQDEKKVVQSAAAAKVANNAAKWAKKIANDDSFHYGNGLHSHHNGCYFCGTQPSSKKKYVVQWEKTYCCNPFVTAAYAHGGKESFMLSLCSRGKSYMAPQFKNCELFANLGHPDQSELLVGDILCSSGHVAIYVGNGKLAEAWISDDGKPNSSKWNKSIAVNTLTASRYKGFNAGVFRYIGEKTDSSQNTAYAK